MTELRMKKFERKAEIRKKKVSLVLFPILAILTFCAATESHLETIAVGLTSRKEHRINSLKARGQTPVLPFSFVALGMLLHFFELWLPYLKNG